jgi:hypothetical protein
MQFGERRQLREKAPQKFQLLLTGHSIKQKDPFVSKTEAFTLVHAEQFLGSVRPSLTAPAQLAIALTAVQTSNVCSGSWLFSNSGRR